MKTISISLDYVQFEKLSDIIIVAENALSQQINHLQKLVPNGTYDENAITVKVAQCKKEIRDISDLYREIKIQQKQQCFTNLKERIKTRKAVSYE